MKEAIRTFKVLSDPTRLRVLSLILERECCVCEVMQALDISQSKASRALSALYEAGFLKLRKEGLWSLYSLEETQSAYLGKLVEAVELALKDNKAIQMDRQRLKTTTRTGFSCPRKGSGVCSNQPGL